MTLTRLQQDVLWIVVDHGPVTAADVDHHVPIGRDSARGVLGRLEARGLVGANYTSGGGRARAYEVTTAGESAFAAYSRELEEELDSV